MTASACPAPSAIPLPGVSVRVTDPETGKEIARDEIGMIEVKGPNVFKGYWRMPEKTKSEFRDDGFFITGDLGKIDAKGYVHILGRGKDLVISGGFNVYPKEIESEIDAMPGVIESAVIGVPHADFGEGVTAVVVCNKGADVTEAGVLKALDGRLAKFKMPKRVFVVDELPRNAMGKVQKNILRDTYKDIYSKHQGREPSRRGIMNREQAVRIQKHVFDADVALDHASMAIADLGKEERLALDGLLQEAVETLHLDLLAQIYDQYPDLEPPPLDEEIPTISSSLTWDRFACRHL